MGRGAGGRSVALSHTRLTGSLSPKPSLITYASTLAGVAVLLKVRVGRCWDDAEARSDEHPTFGLTSLNFNHFGLDLIGPWGESRAGKSMGRGRRVLMGHHATLTF